MLFFYTAISISSQSDTVAYYSFDHLCTLTAKATWQNLPKIKENLKCWKTLLKEKISTFYSNGLSRLLLIAQPISHF